MAEPGNEAGRELLGDELYNEIFREEAPERRPSPVEASSTDVPELILNSTIVDVSSESSVSATDATIMIPSGGSFSVNPDTAAVRQQEKDSAPKKERATKSLRLHKNVPKRWLYIAAVVLAVVATVITAILVRRSSDSGEYDGYLSRGSELYADAKYDEALTYLRKASAIRADDEVLSLIADCYCAQGNFDCALDALRSMDTTVPAVAERIVTVEARRLASLPVSTVRILGKDYNTDTLSLNLDNSGLTDSAIPEIVQLYSLSSLSVADNRISDISGLSALGGLIYLDLSRNAVTDLSPVSALSSLRTLVLDGNRITDFSPLYSLSNLCTLSIRDIELTRESREALSAALPSCVIQAESGDDSVEISLGGISFDMNAETIELSDSGLTDISALSSCRNVKYLNLSGNAISDISPLLSLPCLETLILSGNQISNIYPLMGISTLQRLNLDDNQISDITALEALSSLKELSLRGNPLSSLEGLSSLNYLESLNVAQTGLNDSLLSSLETAFSLCQLDISDNPELTGNGVDQLRNKLSNCTVLGGNYPHIVSIGRMECLENQTEVNLSGKGLEDISAVRGFLALEALDLSNNYISNIYPLELMPRPEMLKVLNLSGNSISDITCLSSLTGLETLDLSGNPIAVCNPLLTLTALKELNLTNCGLSDGDILRICNALPNCKVLY